MADSPSTGRLATLSPSRRSPGLPRGDRGCGLSGTCHPGCVPSLHDPEPPAADLWCQRAGVCRHPFPQHAPGGGACLWWDPETRAHCGCRGFLYVSPPGSGPPDHPRYRGAPEVLPRLR